MWAPVVLYGFGALFITYTLISSLKVGRQAYEEFDVWLVLVLHFREMLPFAESVRAGSLNQQSVACKVFKPQSKAPLAMYLCIAVLHVVVVAAAVQLYCS
jgi:hypothetical protein